MEGSESDDSRERGAKAAGEAEAAPVPEGAVIAEAGPGGEAEEAGKEQSEPKEPKEPGAAKKEEDAAEEGAANQSAELAVSAKPSYTLLIRNLPGDVDLEELEMRLKRWGEVVSLQKEEGVVVAKFSRTQEAYEARERLSGTDPYDNGSKLEVDFGAQDAEHYNRGRKRVQGKGRKEFLDAGSMAAELDAGRAGNNKSRSLRAFPQDGDGDEAGSGGVSKAEPDAGDPGKRRKADGGAPEDAPEAKAARSKADAPRAPAVPAGPLTPPAKPVSRWTQELTFEEQLEDFMKMKRRGMYNRYLVLGKLPLELRTGEAIWRMMHPVQRDIVHVEMLTCFGKPVAHVALRSATAAAAMHRLCEQMHQNLTVAFAPPRRASATLWLGNVDDFVQRKELEVVLGEYGKIVNGLRYLPARTCAFVTYSEAADAVTARNTLYGLEVQRNQYLNVDFVEEAEQGMDGWGMWGSPWGATQPWMPPWGVVRPWGPQPGPWGGMQGMMRSDQRGQRGRRDDRGRGADGPPPPPPAWGPTGMQGRYSAQQAERQSGKRDRRRTRSRSRRGHGDQEATPEPPKNRRRREPSAPAREQPAPPAAGEPQEKAHEKAHEKPQKPARVKLYKMGEFCCNIVPTYVKGREGPDALVTKLHIDQRTKVDHCRSHLDRAGPLATVWHFSAADRRDCAAYDALCDYFVEKGRVGLVQTPSYYMYIVPPTEKYLKELGLPTSNFVVGLQIPIKK